MHLFKYRMIQFSKQKTLIFWSLAFPFALATLFNFAFGTFNELGIFEAIDVTVVDEGNVEFNELLNQLEEEEILNIEYNNNEEASKLLEEEEVQAVLISGEEVELLFYEESMDVRILNEIIKSYMRVSSTMGNIVEEVGYSESVVNSVLEDEVVIESMNLKATESSFVSQYFFTALAMSIIYGSFWGIRSLEAVQANQSSVALRLNVTPTNKIKVVAIDFICSFIMVAVTVILLITYFTKVLGVEFGTDYLLTTLVCLSGMVMSISGGFAIGALSKLNATTNVNIVSTLTVFSCFLAGMMESTIPYSINNVAPFVKYINPATLITNSFNILYYYESYTDVYINIIIMTAIGFVLMMASYHTLRRKEYDSI